MAKPALRQAALPLINILLVEDNISDAYMVEHLLNENADIAYKIFHVKTQTEALDALAKTLFDVCLLDLALPDASGFSALTDIQEKSPDMPILILTGFNDAALAKHAVGRGAQDYLLKDELELSALSRAIDYSMERKRLEKGLFQRANYDALTGLANRNMFVNRLMIAAARADRLDSNITVLFIDLDSFKPINDKHGHDAGDETLRVVSQRIKAILRAYDMAARLGGDEFAILLEGINSTRDAAVIAQKIIKSIATPMPYHGRNLHINASIGIAFSETVLSPDTLLQQADTAMYHAKKSGGGSYRFYAHDMQSTAVECLGIEEDLRTALSADELELHYQSYVTPDGDAVLGVEALLRWKHPERGLLCANDFLAAAEEARLMPEIGKWMCSHIRHDIAMWNAHDIAPLHIAINLSISQLDAPDVLQWFTSLAQKDFLGHHRLAVEIPEEALSSLTHARTRVLEKLSDMDIELHLDHFGRGSLSLTALHSFPFSIIKLDMSLIKNMSEKPSGDTLIRAAIMLAHELGIKAGAVGVEADWQATALKAQSCDVIQGYLTMQPLTAKQLAYQLETQS